MKVKKIRADILVGVSLVLVVLGGIGMMMPPEREPDGIMENRFGDVRWNHELHARMKSIANCTVCHHSEKQGEMDLRPCSDCHKAEDNRLAMINPELFMTVAVQKYEGENGPPPMKALHSSCLGCHKAVKQGPVVCRDCHAQTFTGLHGKVKWDHTLHSRTLDMTDGGEYDNNCVSCHHQDGEAESEADYRPCGSCHQPGIVNNLSFATNIRDHENVKHGQCQECHVDFNPEDDNVACVQCHEGIEVDTDVLAPSIEQAVHQKCSTCHNKDVVGVGSKTPALCGDCHQPDPSWIPVPEAGVVVWDHERHGRYGGIECETCHHTDNPGAPKLACSSCHGAEEEVKYNLKESLEQTCLECHKKEKVGLTTWKSITTKEIKHGTFEYKNDTGSFWWDHRIHAFGMSLSCKNCHHNIIVENGEYVTAKKADLVFTESAGEIQSCKNCHGDDGPVPGSVAAGSEAPSVDDAYKLLCTDCHQKLAGGPQTWEEYYQQETLVKQ